jgi:hypothetical protein
LLISALVPHCRFAGHCRLMLGVLIVAMTPAMAAEVVTWRYPAPYDCYDMTGKGIGREAIRAGLEFGRHRFSPAAFRVTIATFNVRAQRVISALGFGQIDAFQATTDGRSYGIWVRPELGRTV